MKTKIKSSALLIAIALGVVVSGLVIGASVAMGQFAKMSAQARDGKIAYRAALSGIDDGLLRYKYAKAQNKVGGLLGSTFSNIPLPQKDVSYTIFFKMDSISVGKVGKDSPVEQLNPVIGDLKDKPENARAAKMDETIDIDLTYLTSKSSLPLEERPKSIKVSFTSPFELGATTPLLDYFTAMNVKITDIAAQAEKQSVFEKTNSASSSRSITINSVDLANCNLPSARCHLRLKPQIASSTMLLNGTQARRLSGAKENGKKKMVFYAIKAQGLDSTDNAPGTIILTSVGSAGGAKRKVEATIDAGSGSYLGIFDYGIYCGQACEGI